MQRIALTKATPGMVLAQSVRRQDGLVLVGEGLALTDAVIDRIRQAGVATVWVEGTPLGPDGGIGDLRTIAGRLPFLFRRQKANVFMMTLYSVISRHLARAMAEQQAREDAIIEAARQKAEEAGGSGE